MTVRIFVVTVQAFSVTVQIFSVTTVYDRFCFYEFINCLSLFQLYWIKLQIIINPFHQYQRVPYEYSLLVFESRGEVSQFHLRRYQTSFFLIAWMINFLFSWIIHEWAKIYHASFLEKWDLICADEYFESIMFINSALKIFLIWPILD